jgi:hypothetical protein
VGQAGDQSTEASSTPVCYAHRYEGTVDVSAAPADVFDLLDDQERLAAHMRKPSAMMGGGRMTYAFDEGRGRRVGSHIRMGGSAFGLTLDVDEVVTVREPPTRKIWRTVGAPRLLIIGAYQMGFHCQLDGGGARLRVWIEYNLPRSFAGRLLGLLFAPAYARWCVRRMLTDAVKAFAAGPPGQQPGSAGPG